MLKSNELIYLWQKASALKNAFFLLPLVAEQVDRLIVNLTNLKHNRKFSPLLKSSKGEREAYVFILPLLS